MKGKFKCTNPSKYKGDAKNIIYRSGWELKEFMRLDNDINIIEWSSEEIRIPYISPVDMQRHIYFPDLWYRMKDGTIILAEIKPSTQVVPPTKGKKTKRVYLKEVFEYGKNIAKWRAAETYCKNKGWKFKIFTERDLGIPNGRYTKRK